MIDDNNFNNNLLDKDDEENEARTEDIELEKESNSPFDPTKIRVDTKPMTIDLILKRIEYEEIDLAPDFQRQKDIWTPEAQSRLIESIIIRIPLPAFYLDATDDEKWLVIDGLQRLSTLKKFVLDQKLKLKGLEFLEELEGKTYNELHRSYQRRINETILTVYLIEKGTPPKVKYNIFRRINTGGEPLSSQELRHALNLGKASKFLTKLANLPEFKKLTNLGKNRIKRMVDREFILGFAAFYLTDYKNYSPDKGRDDFLNEAMKKINKFTQEEEHKIEKNFSKAMKAAYDIFEDNAFRKIYSQQSRKTPINQALFGVWSVCLAKLSDQEIKTLINKKEQLKKDFIYEIENDVKFLQSISQSADKVDVIFSTIEKIIKGVIS